MQCNGMEWNGMYACMYTVHIPISSHIALVFFPSVGFGPILFQLNSRGPGPGSKWPDPPVSVSPMAFVPWKSWKSAQLRMEWYMNDMWMIHEYINYINHNIEILRYMMCTTEVCKLRSPVPSLGNSAPAFPTWNALSKKCICRRSKRSFSSFTRLRILEVYLSCSGPK